jgi:hypothetical protein
MTKLIIHLSLLFTLLFVYVSGVFSQNTVFAGYDKSVAAGSIVQLNAIPIGDGVWDTVPNMNNNTTYSKICYANDTTLYAISTGNLILKSIDSGKTWTSKALNYAITSTGMAFYDNLNGVICGANSMILVTSDGGETWNKTFDGGSFKFTAVKYISKTTIIVTESANFLRSYNSGNTWTMGENPTNTKGVLDFTMDPKGNIFGYSFTKLFKVNNYIVDSLNTISSNIPLGLLSFNDNNSAIAVSKIGVLMHLHIMDHDFKNSMFNQIPIDSVYEEEPWLNGVILKKNGLKFSNLSAQKINFVSQTVGYIIGYYLNDGYVLKSEDGGFSWMIFKKFAGKRVYGISFNKGSIAVSGTNLLAIFKPETSVTDTYSWSPAYGLNNSNIQHPIATVTSPISYTVTRKSGNVTSTSTVNIDVESLKILSVGHNNLGCTGSIPLEHVHTNYNGPATLTYQWSPSTGLSSDAIANPIFTDSQVVPNFTGDTARFMLTVSIPNGETVQKEIKVTRKALKIYAGLGKSYICGVTSSGTKLGPVYTNYTGSQALDYRWFSMGLPSLANDPNPEVPVPTKNTTYTLEIRTPEGCFQKTTVTLTVVAPTINVGNDKTIECGSSTLADPLNTNMTNVGNLRYKWIPAVGLSNDTIASPVFSPKVTTTYTLTVSNSTGCSASDALTITVNPLTVNAGEDKSTVCNAPVQLAPLNITQNLKYKWTPATGLSNDTIASPYATIAKTTEYTLTVTNQSGCAATDKAKVFVTTLDKPAIDYVGVTSTNKNILFWTKPNNPNAVSYILYRESNETNSYTKIGELTNNTISSFIDTLSFPDVQSNKYKMSVVDQCGNESPLSDPHKTMHLSINQGLNGTWNLIWEQYLGFNVSTYNIYRGTNRTDIRQIGSLSGSNSQFSDFTAPAGYVYYQVEAVSAQQINAPSKIKSVVTNSDLTPKFTSRSNIATNKSGIDGVFELKDVSASMSIFPNPATQKFELKFNSNITENTYVKVIDIAGVSVKNIPLSTNQLIVDMSEFSNGVYFVFVQSNSFVAKQKLILEK